MSLRSLERLKALILILMALFLANLFVSGRLFFYIGPRFSWLSLAAVTLLILMAGSYRLVGDAFGTSGHEHASQNGWALPFGLIALPLILGTVIPAKPLGANAIGTRGFATSFGAPRGEASGLQSEDKTVLDWVQAINANPDPSSLNGQKANTIGFVYRDFRLSQDQFMLVRYAVTCCVADALAIGIVVDSPESHGLKADSWVTVKGTFRKSTVDGKIMPVLFAEDVAPIQPPEQPYLYP